MNGIHRLLQFAFYRSCTNMDLAVWNIFWTSSEIYNKLGFIIGFRKNWWSLNGTVPVRIDSASRGNIVYVQPFRSGQSMVPIDEVGQTKLSPRLQPKWSYSATTQIKNGNQSEILCLKILIQIRSLVISSTILTRLFCVIICKNKHGLSQWECRLARISIVWPDRHSKRFCIRTCYL